MDQVLIGEISQKLGDSVGPMLGQLLQDICPTFKLSVSLKLRVMLLLVLIKSIHVIVSTYKIKTEKFRLEIVKRWEIGVILDQTGVIKMIWLRFKISTVDILPFKPGIGSAIVNIL